MSIDGTPVSRLRKLEVVYNPPQTCSGAPVRAVYADPETEIPWHTDLPDDGCPECGRRSLS